MPDDIPDFDDDLDDDDFIDSMCSVANAIDRNAEATTAFSKAAKRRFRVVYSALALLAAIVVLGGSFTFVRYENRSEESLRLSHLALDQQRCFSVLQGHFEQAIGAVRIADANRLGGNPPDAAAMSAATKFLADAGTLVNATFTLCYDERGPVKDPLRALKPDGTIDPDAAR